MTVTVANISSSTPMGANLLSGGGATFRVWAPNARAVHVVGTLGGGEDWLASETNKLVRDNAGYWAGFVAQAREGDHYKFYVIGEAHRSYKRDPYARELSQVPAYPFSNCVLRDATTYTWRATSWHSPAFNDLVIYQFHLGTFAGNDPAHQVGTFLDVLDRIDHWKKLGINAVEPLPVVEFSSPRSMGYDGSDLFSPEMDYTLEGPAVERYLEKANALLAQVGQAPVDLQILAVPINQFKLFVDICHLNGIAVILDVVYNHAGLQIGGQEESIWFFDWAQGDHNASLYFTDQEHVGPVFAFWKPEVRQFLIDNAWFFVEEYRVDGLRYDQVSVIDVQNRGSGWQFCQHCTSTMRASRPEAINIAEYWPVNPSVIEPVTNGGGGFDATWTDGFREAIRDAVRAASVGASGYVDMRQIGDALYMHGFHAKWKGVQYVESHDAVYRDRDNRMPRLADGSNSRSWYARSRSRVATGLVLTAPGIPLLFMGQEFLEDKQWSDDPGHHPELLLYWAGVNGADRHMVDFHRFVSDLIKIRNSLQALRGDGLKVIVADNYNRILAFHRWADGAAPDVVVLLSLNDSTFADYRVGFPAAGRWREIFNSDLYDHFPNPFVSGNGGEIWSDATPMHDMPASARTTIPANAILVFIRRD